MPTKSFDLAIVGGGISGLTLAIGLIRRNVPITIYESASQFSEIGAGLGFDPAAAFAMEQIDPRIKEGFLRCTTLNHGHDSNVWYTVRVGDGRKARQDGVVKGKEDVGLKLGEPAWETIFTQEGPRGGVHRGQFLDQLVKLVPEGVAKMGKKLVDIVEGADGDVLLHFADGSMSRHTAVIGCDGIRSKTREILLKDVAPDVVKPVFSGKYAYRGLIPMTKAVEMLGEEQARRSQLYVGYHNHVLTYPIEKGNTMNVVAFGSRETWTDPNWVVSTSKQDMLADFETWCPAIQSIITAMQKTDIWALFHHLPAPTYCSSSICLVGDAAHASTPHQAAGACFCMADCFILCNLIEEAETVHDLARAFRAYDEIRRPPSQKLVKTSKEAAMLYEFELEGDDLDVIEKSIQERMSRVWEVDLESEMKRAKERYDSMGNPPPRAQISEGARW